MKHEKGMREALAESKSLIRGLRMGINSTGKSKNPGSLSERITTTLIYGKERKSETDFEIGEIKKA